jgi:protein involved in polysaccharide export with SLBB domain
MSLLCTVRPTQAQPAQPPAQPAQPPAQAEAVAPGLITSPTYQISVEDTLDVSVATLDGFGPTVASRQLIVLSDGTADVPFLGETKVTGLTIADLKAKIRKAVSKNLTRPDISVAVRARFQKMVNVFGVTVSKGKIPLRDNWHVRDVIAAAGGLPTDRYDFLDASLLRNRTGELIPINLHRLLDEQDTAQNYPVEADDTLIIRQLDEAQTQIQVIGEVLHPGAVLLPRSRSIVEVLQATGGPTERASLAQTTIERNGKNIVIDLTNYRKNGFDPQEKLQMGDRLVVPTNIKEYYLYGNVGHGGNQPYPEDRTLTVSQAIALSGGIVQGAELKKTRLIRTSADGKTKFTTVINVEKMLKTGDMTGDMKIEPGDSIYVPPAGRSESLNFAQILGIASAATGLIFYLQRAKL